jgi:Mor family transcriptional regulator
VLLLRLQTVTLTDALRKLWPHLLNELESIFREKTPDQYLIIEAIKVVELMSALNIEDF